MGRRGAGIGFRSDDRKHGDERVCVPPSPIIPNCSMPSPQATWCGGPGRRMRACAFTVRSKRACNRPIASCLAVWSKALGRRKRRAIPGSAARCGASSGSICPNDGSACPRTTSRRRSARPMSFSPARPKSPARRPSHRVFCSALPRSPAKSPWEETLQARRKISRLGAYARPAGAREPCDAPGSDAAGRGAAEAADRDRDRALAARSVHDLRQAHSQTGRARSGRYAARRARSRHRHPRSHRRIHRAIRESAACRSGGGADCDRSRKRSSRWRIIRRRAPSGGRVFSASHAGLRGGKLGRRAKASGDLRRDTRRDRCHSRISGSVRAPTASSASPTAATPFSITRPDNRRRDSEVKAGLAPQLTLEGAILRRGGFKDIPAGASLAELAYLRLSGGRSGRQSRHEKQFDNSSPDEEADKALARLRGVVGKIRAAGQRLINPSRGRNGSAAPIATTIISRA